MIYSPGAPAAWAVDGSRSTMLALAASMASVEPLDPELLNAWFINME